MNESIAGRDGYILAMGRRIHHVYKQDFPMEFWYGLTPEDNREDSANLIDVRTLPERFRTQPVEVELVGVARRSWNKLLRFQLKAHALAFANAIFHGYDLAAHVARENEQALAADAERRAKKAELAASGTCSWCGLNPATVDGECQDCFEIPF